MMDKSKIKKGQQSPKNQVMKKGETMKSEKQKYPLDNQVSR